MEKGDLSHWKSAIIEGVIGAVLVIVFNIVVVWIAKPNIGITLTDSIIEENGYITTITINNYSREAKNLDIYFLESNTINEILAGKSFVIDYSNATLKTNKIPPHSNESIVVSTAQQVSKSNFRYSTDGIIYVSFLSDQWSMSLTTWINLAMMFIIIVVFSLILNGIGDKKIVQMKKERQESEKKHEELNNKSEEAYKSIKKELIESNKLAIKNERRLKWLETYYIVRFADFSKELSFWKDTVRKMLYSWGVGKRDSEQLFDLVTDSLKTFSVKEKGFDMHEVTLIAQRMSENSKFLYEEDSEQAKE